MLKIFGRHHVRSNFYHFVSAIFLLTMILWFFGIIPDKVSTIIGMILFITDYIAEMYDPHPETPGPWFESHFHRFFDGGKEDDKTDCEFEKRLFESDHKFLKNNAHGKWMHMRFRLSFL